MYVNFAFCSACDRALTSRVSRTTSNVADKPEEVDESTEQAKHKLIEDEELEEGKVSCW